MSGKKTTIYDIAEQLNITPSTVSRALSDHPRISKKTKAAVRQVADELQYQHNGIASALRSGKTFIIGVVVPTADRSFFSSVVRGIEQVANQAGYNVMITQSNDNMTLEKSNVQALLKAQVDGVIASIGAETTDFDHFRQIRAKKIPLVLFDRVQENLGASTVVIDDYLGAYRATQHLIEQGYQRIAHFAGTQHLNIYKYRFRGYREALEEAGMNFDPDLVVQSSVKLEDGRASMKQLLQLPSPPDAVFASSDYSAIGAMQVLKENGYQLPQDFGLVGFANEPFTSFVEPGLTTVDQTSEQMGQFAARIFLEQINAKAEEFVPRKTVLTPKLIIRPSSQKKQDFE